MVVIAIIGLLSGIIVASLSTAKQASRDAKRIADMNGIKLALSLYYNDNNKYPPTLATLLTGGYLPAVPKDPMNTGNYVYKYVCLMQGGPFQPCNSGGPRFHLGAVLEQSSNTALQEDAQLGRNANSYTEADGQSDFEGESTTCSTTLGTDSCYDLSGY